jgi:hypothetical protein
MLDHGRRRREQQFWLGVFERDKQRLQQACGFRHYERVGQQLAHHELQRYGGNRSRSELPPGRHFVEQHLRHERRAIYAATYVRAALT